MLFGAALLWALWHHGATEAWALYGLFLLLLAPALLACFSLSPGGWRDLRWMLAVGVMLLAHTALAPSFVAEGWTLLAAGWLALFSSWTIAAKSLRSAWWLAAMMILAGAGEALLGLLQASGAVFADTHETRDRLAATGTFVNRNHFAGLLNMTLPLAAGVVFAGWTRRLKLKTPKSEILAWGWLMVLGCSLIGVAVLLSRSRGGVLTLAATLLLLAAVLGRDRFARTPSGESSVAPSGRTPAVAVGLLAVVVLGLGLALGRDTFLERFAQVGESGQNRMTLYRDTLGLIADHPLLGVGPGMYRWRFRAYQTEDFEHRYDHAHNDYLETAAEWGVAAALAFWVFVFRRGYRAARLFLRSRASRRRGLALGSAGAVASIALHSLVDFNLQIAANWIFFCGVLGLAWGLERAPSRRRSPS